MEFFYLKKLIATLVSPVLLVVLLLTIALVVAWFTQTKAWLRWPLTLAWSLLFLLSVYPISASWLMHYEGLYPYYQPEPARPVEQIVVLGCYALEDPLLPVSSQLHPCSLVRLVEGMRIWRLHPEAEIILSGGASRFGHSSVAQIGANLLVSLGVPAEKIVLKPAARDTESEAATVKSDLKNSSPVLVTSATHMKRAIRIFARHGIHVIPAPTEHLVRAASGQESNWREWAPNAQNLYRSERALYATLANTLVTLQGVIGDVPEQSLEPKLAPQEQGEIHLEPESERAQP